MERKTKTCRAGQFLRIAMGIAMLCALVSCEDETPTPCQVGSESCDCTGGGSCDPGLTCMSNKCVNVNGDTSEGDTSQGDTSPDTADTNVDEFPTAASYNCSEGYCKTLSTKCSLTNEGRIWCVNDCESKRAKVPQKCAILWINAMKCGEKPESWTCSGQSASLVGCQNEQSKLDYCTNPEGFGEPGECTTAPCCENCSLDCDHECGTNLDCFKACYWQCLTCCEKCLP